MESQKAEQAVKTAEQVVKQELASVPKLTVQRVAPAERLVWIVEKTEGTVKKELGPVGDRITTLFEQQGVPKPTIAKSDATAVNIVDRQVPERHALQPAFEYAAAKIDLVLRCREDIRNLASRPELVERYFPGSKPEKLSDGQRKDLTGRVLLEMGYSPEEVRSWITFSGLYLSTAEKDTRIAGAEQLIDDGVREKDPIRREVMARMANALVSEMAVDYGKYIIWECSFSGYNLGTAKGPERFRQANKDFVQLMDAQSYVAYSRMFCLYNLTDKSGRHLAEPSERLEKRYLELVGSPKDVTPREYGEKIEEFRSFYAKYSSNQLEAYERETALKQAKGLEKAYVLVSPYVESAIPLAVAGIMTLDPAGIPLGTLYFGSQAVQDFRQRDYLTGTLLSLTLIAPFLAPLRASASLESIATAGRAVSVTAGIALQVDIAKNAVDMVYNGVKQGEFSTSDITGLINAAGFMAMPGVVRKGSMETVIPKTAETKYGANEVKIEPFAQQVKELNLGEWESTALKYENVELTIEDPEARELMKNIPESVQAWKALFLENAEILGLRREAALEYAERHLRLIDKSEKAPYAVYGHNLRVAQYAELMMEQMGLPMKEKAEIILGAEVHDIGKIMVKKEILAKNGKLSDEEYDRVKDHSVGTAVICLRIGRQVNGIPEEVVLDVSKIAACHHENFDGTGTFGLAGNDIPLGARILRILDSFDTMASKRRYKVPMSLEDMIRDLNGYKGTYYEPALVDELTSAIRSNPVAFEKIMSSGR